MRALKEALLREYGSFADKRIKNIDKGSRFLVDDRHDGGLASDGSPYGWFCSISAEVLDEDSVRVSLSNLPEGPSVAAWADAMAVTGTSVRTELVLTHDTLELLTGLAEALRSIVAPGAPWYSTASYKYACPRAADSLDRLERALARAWGGAGRSRTGAATAQEGKSVSVEKPK
jgi:hypothetical protein